MEDEPSGTASGAEMESGTRRSGERSPLIETPIKYPRSVFFIIVTEFCERFSYTGMRTILTMYIRNVLYRGVPNAEDIATVIYHAFVSLCYFTPLLGGIIADSFLGKYKTILYISIFYAIGNCILSLSAVTPLHLPMIPFSLLGLALIGFGTGGIKPCVNAFAGDQFKLPEQSNQLHQFFFFFYFAINLGSLSSNFVTPIMRRDVSCFGHETCYSLAFGTPAILWIVALMIFLLGSRYYNMKKPEGNVALEVVGCVWHALTVKDLTSPGKFTGSHWLDKARGKYSASFIEDVKVLFRIMVLLLPLPIYWALYEQQGSTWTLQATRMKGYISPYLKLKPDQMQAINSFLILFFIPLFERIIYPLLGKCHLLKTSLQRMCCGCIMVSVAFVISGVVELNIEPTYPILPSSTETSLNLINALPCPVDLYMQNINVKDTRHHAAILEPYENIKFQKIPAGHYLIATEIWRMGNCTTEVPIQRNLNYQFDAVGGKAYSTLLTTNSEDNSITLNFTEDDLEKSREGDAKLKFMYTPRKPISPNATLELIRPSGPRLKISLDVTGGSTPEKEIDPDMYKICLSEGSQRILCKSELLDEGGNYILAVFPEQLVKGPVVDMDSKEAFKLFVLTNPSSIHMLYLLPQYVVLTLAELFFSITGFTFAYTQAPVSMKAVIQSLWLLTIGLGSSLVIVITSLNYFDRPAMQFFSYSVIMLFGTIIFIVLAYRYKPNDSSPDLATYYSKPVEKLESAEFVMDSEEIRTMALDIAQ